MPRVEVRAEHHDFVFQIGAWNFSDHIRAVQILIVILCRNIEFELHQSATLNHSNDSVVVLGGYDNLRNEWRRVLVADCLLLVSRCAFRVSEGRRLDEHRSTVATSRFENQPRSFLLEHQPLLVLKSDSGTLFGSSESALTAAALTTGCRRLG